MNFKLFFGFFVALFAMVAAKPWIQVDLPLPLGPEARSVEMPIMRHPTECGVFLLWGYPMPCGEGQAFHSEKLACVAEEEADC